MRKRRRLANKMTMMLCAVLIAVSAFFYAPMNVSASGVNIGSNNIKNLDFGSTADLSGTYYLSRETYTNSIKLSDLVSGSIISSDLYKVNLSIDFTCTSNVSVYLQQIFVRMANGYLLFAGGTELLGSSTDFTYSANVSREYYLSGSFLLSSQNVHTNFLVRKGSDATVNLNGDVKIVLNSIELVDNADSDLYQEGYNDGYQVGLEEGGESGYNLGYSAGESAGYSDGFEAGVGSVDTDSFYDSGYESGFNAGVGSVDTQSYYDAGYQAGYEIAYNAGYSEGLEQGYENGYSEGYQSAMNRIDGWGADTADYPLLLSESSEPFNLQFGFIEEGSDEFVYSDYSDVERYYSDVDFDPNHTYKLEFSYHDFTYDYDTFFTSSFSFWLYWGDSSFPLIVGTKNDITTTVFIPGDRVGNGLRFRCDLGQIESNGSIDTLHYYLNGCYLKLYDMGPSGDTQNHIANQTDSLTNGFDNSQGNSVNSDLSSGLNEYQTSEDTLWATATTGLKDFTFFDFASVPAMITGMSFITAIMGSWFNQAGGASGVGIVLSILFSVILVAMVLGLYRWYQSRGGKD